MSRVIGIDPGTITLDICGIDDGRVFLDRSVPTGDALRDPASLVRVLEDAHREMPVDVIAGPSGYGLPLVAARDLTENDLRLAFLAAEGESGGIGGLRTLVRALGRTALPVVLTPGVIHLSSVPAHRKVNRVDMGTADKVCSTALAIHAEAERRRCAECDVSFILLELGGAFSAAIAVHRGQIVDGLGGSSGPLGMRAAGALDGEVAFLAGTTTKAMLFQGGAAAIAGKSQIVLRSPTPETTARERVAWDALIEGAAKAVAALIVSVPGVRDVIVSGRVAQERDVREALVSRLEAMISPLSIRTVTGFAHDARQAAQGAALMADGLAGGRSRSLVETMRIRDAAGTALDHLYVITPEQARSRLGIA